MPPARVVAKAGRGLRGGLIRLHAKEIPVGIKEVNLADAVGVLDNDVGTRYVDVWAAAIVLGDEVRAEKGIGIRVDFDKVASDDGTE